MKPPKKPQTKFMGQVLGFRVLCLGFCWSGLRIQDEGFGALAYMGSSLNWGPLLGSFM